MKSQQRTMQMPANYVAGDLIAAISTVAQPGFRSIVRLSGEGAVDAAAGLFDDAAAAAIRAAGGFSAVSARLDGLPVEAFIFRAPRSYTREDVLELHLPSGSPWAQDVLGRLVDAGARPAAPGEFTRRALENGRISVAEAAGVLELITAEERSAARTGARLLAGEAPAALRRALEDLKRVYAEIAAAMDFPDDVDAAPDGIRQTLAGIIRLLEGSGGASAGCSVRAALLGEVNAGKTTLFNGLSGEDGIVSSVPGTTRDALYAQMHIGRRDVLLADAPGIHGDDEISAAASALALREADGADIVLLCLPCDAGSWHVQDFTEALRASRTEGVILVATKSDLAPPDEAWAAGAAAASGAGKRVLARASSAPGTFDDVRAALEQVVASGCVETGLLTPAVMNGAVDAARRRVEEALDAERAGMSDACAASVESALMVLEGLFAPGGGETDEAVLEEIFSRFCVGK